MKKIFILILGLMTMFGCSSDDKASPASEEQMQKVSGHWYALLPVSGEIENWRTEEEGDLTTYDHIGVVVYLNGSNPGASFWGYLYIQNGEMVNYDGLFLRDEEANFSFTMNSDGVITPSSYLPDAPQVSNMRYANDVITANVNFKGRSINLIFAPLYDNDPTYKEFFDILIEEGIIGGYSDKGDELNTDVSDKGADQSARAIMKN